MSISGHEGPDNASGIVDNSAAASGGGEGEGGGGGEGGSNCHGGINGGIGGCENVKEGGNLVERRSNGCQVYYDV